MRLWQARGLARPALVMVAIIVLGAATIHASPAPPSGGVFRYNFTRDYAGARLDVGKGFTMLGANVFTGLTRVDPDNKVIPGAAERWEVKANGTQYIFHIRKDMKWSDGQALTARDFEFAWKRVLDPATKSVRAWMLYPIKGAEEYYTGTGTREGVGVRALDDFTLQVDLARPSVYFPAYIAANNPYYAVPKHVVEKFGDVWVRPENVVFSGPFKITRYVPNSLIVMEPNPYWPLKKPSVSRIEYNVVPAAATALAMYEAGQLDFAMGLPFGETARIRNDPRLRDQFVVLPAFRIGTFNFNTKRSPWNNLKVRQAFMRAIDSDELTKGPFQGVLPSAYSLRPAQLPGGNLDYMRQLRNVEAAKALLAEAGYPDGKGFPEASIQVANEEDSKIAAEYLQQRFARVLGVRVSVRVMDTAAWLDAVQTGKGDSWVSAVWSQCPDLFDLYNVVEGSAASNNMWKQTFVSQLFRRAAGEPDIARRLRLYDQAEKQMVIENAVMVPLWVTDQPSLVSNKVKNLKNDKRSFWIHTYEWVEMSP